MLMQVHTPFLRMPRGVPFDHSLVWLGTGNDPANSTSYVFSSFAISALPASGYKKYLLIMPGGDDTNSFPTTITGSGGVGSFQPLGGFSQSTACMVADATPSSLTSSNITINFSTTQASCIFGMWAYYTNGADIAVLDTSIVSGTQYGGVVAPAGSKGILICRSDSASDVAHTPPSNWTEQAELFQGLNAAWCDASFASQFVGNVTAGFVSGTTISGQLLILGQG